MFHPAVHDLVKPQWLAVLELLKKSGGLSVPAICRSTGGSYMTAKAHCEELAGRGYLVRTRLPGKGMGRPEIEYSLSLRADALFAAPDTGFALDILSEARSLFGDIAPERLIHQWFQKRTESWREALQGKSGAAARTTHLAKLRTADGWSSSCERDPLRLIDHHHPMQRIFEAHPRAIVIEKRMLEDLLGAAITRREISGGREGMPVVIHEIG